MELQVQWVQQDILLVVVEVVFMLTHNHQRHLLEELVEVEQVRHLR
jgi:hypothetical protein